MTDNLWTGAGDEAAPPPPPPRSQRWWPVALVVAVLIGVGIWGWSSRTAAAGIVLHVGSQRGGTKALMLASGALDGAPYRVEWSEFPAAQTLLEAIGAGAVDVGLAGDAPFQFAYQGGQPLRAVAAISSRGRPQGSLAILVPRGSSVAGIEDLRGRRIATTRGSIGHYLILRALAETGMTPADVRVTFLSPGDTKAAFDTGSIDAWSTWTPYTGAAIAGGARIVVDGNAYLSGTSFDVASDRAIATKRPALADFLRREARAMDWSRTHQQDFVRVLAHETGLPESLALFHAQHLPMSRGTIDAATKAEEQAVVATFRKAGLLAGTRSPDEAYVPLDEGGGHAP